MKTWDGMVEKIAKSRYPMGVSSKWLEDRIRREADRDLRNAIRNQLQVHIEGGMMVRDTHRGHVTLVDMTEIPRPGWYALVPVPEDFSP